MAVYEIAQTQVMHLEERRRSMSIRLYGLDQAWDLAVADLDEIAVLARDALGTDGAGINLLVDDAQVTVGGTVGDTAPVPRDVSICSTVLSAYPGPDVVEIPDLRSVTRFADNPFVDGRIADLRFYAAAPLVGKHGLALGTLCVWSARPQQLDDAGRVLLRQLGRAVVNVLDERRRALVPDVSGALRPAR